MICRTRWFLIWYCILQSWSGVLAQEPVHYQIRSEQGLPSTEVYGVLQDGFGYMWIACDAGLFRYDGFTFRKFDAARQNGRATSFLKLDLHGRVWTKNFFGQIFHTGGDSLHLAYSLSTSEPNNPPFALDEKAQLWIGRDRELLRISDIGTVVERISLDSLAPDESLICLRFLEGKLYGLSQSLKVFRFDPETKRLNWLEWEAKPNGIPTSTSTFLLHEAQLYLFTEINDGLRHYALFRIRDKIQAPIAIEPGAENQRVFGLLSVDSVLWIHTAAGAWPMDPETGRATANVLFPRHQISGMLRDREGMYWFTSLDDGLKVVPHPEVKVLSAANSAMEEDALTCIAALGDSLILLGTYRGALYQYDPGSNGLERVWDAPGQSLLSTKAIVTTDRYTLISRGRLCVVDQQSGKQVYPALYNVRDMALIGDTLVLVFPNFVVQLTIADLLADRPYTVLLEQGGKEVEYDPVHRLLFVSMAEGLQVRDGKGKWEPLSIKGVPIRSTAISYDEGILWVGTVADGVWGFAGKEAIYHFGKSNLLREDDIRIVTARNRQLWVGTSLQIYRIDLDHKKLTRLGHAQSIPASQINDLEVAGGQVYLSTSRGLIHFPADIEPGSGISPNLQVTAMEVNQQAIAFHSAVRLGSEARIFKISFSSVLLGSRGGLSYRYRIAGLTDRWVPLPGNNPEILLSPPPVGHHQIEIQAMNPGGPDSEVLRISLDVDRPVSQRWWFYLLSGLALAVLVSVAFLLRIRQIRRRADLLNRLVSSQLSTLKSQMSPHFLFNTLTSLQDLILEKDTKGAVFYLNKFSKLLRNILDYSNRDLITLAEELEMLRTYLSLQKLRLGEEFEWEIDATQIAHPEQLTLPPMLLQPFVENGIKHGLLHKRGPKKISLTFSEEDALICIVEDNGIGRRNAGEIQNRNTLKHQSFATGATQKRIDLLNSNPTAKGSGGGYAFSLQDLESEGKALGTRVEIRIPLQFTKPN